MNVGTLKTVSYLSSLGLLAGIGYKIYLFLEVEKNVSYIHEERTKEVLAVPAQPVTQRVGLHYDNQVKPAITDFDWTGAPPKPKVKPVDVKPEETVKRVTPVSDLLSVVFTMASETKPGSSECVLRFKGQADKDNSDQFFRVGDSLPKPNDNIAIFSIRPSKVIFSFDDEEREKETLEPSTLAKGQDFIVHTDKDNVVRPSLRKFTAGERLARGSDAPKLTIKDKSGYHIGTDDAELFNTDFQRIFSEDVKLETYMKDGKRAGLKVREVKAGSVAARAGAQAEDVVLSINGNTVTSEQQAIQYVRQNSDSTSVWNVRILRNGREVEEVYHSPED